MSFIKLYSHKYEVITFIAGAAIMVFEISGARLVAPYLGSSTYVWTSIIGVILGALSLGYWLGGIKADSNPSSKLLANILLFSGFLIFLSYSLSTLILTLLQATDSYIFSSFLSSIILFAPASVLLGMVSPLVVRLKMIDVTHSGKTVGNLNALSTLGSIVGTFFAGYLLIPLFGTSTILVSLSILMIMMAIYIDITVLNFKFTRLNSVLGITFCFFALFSFIETKQNVITEFDTLYSHIQIYTVPESNLNNQKDSKRPVQLLQMNAVAHSGMYTDDINDLAIPYTNYYRLAEYFKSDFENTLMIGGGAFSFPKYFIDSYKSATIDVVEIDPMLTKAAFEYFELKENDRLNIIIQDGRIFIDKTNNTYDVIYGDAFSSYLSVPFHLTTLEATRNISKILNEDGVYIVNVIGSLTGPSSEFVQAYLKTLNEVFPSVYAYTVNFKDPSKFQNIMIVAMKKNKNSYLKSEDIEISEMLSNSWSIKIEPNTPILTDNYAPVEYYMKNALKYRDS